MIPVELACLLNNCKAARIFDIKKIEIFLEYGKLDSEIN